MLFSPQAHTLYLVFYGFLAWTAEVVFFAIRDRRFVNRGLLTLPIDYEIGSVFSNVVLLVPTFGRNYLGLYLLTFANLVIIRAVLGFFGSRLTKNAYWLTSAPSGTWQNILWNMVTAGLIMAAALVIHPLLIPVVELIPEIALHIIHVVAWVIILADFIFVVVAMRKGQASYTAAMDRGQAERLSQRLYGSVWKRLDRAYPGITDEKKRSEIVFARGMSADKLVWVFLISAVLGDIVETFYCGLVDRQWMSRSSVVYGPFSFVWGLGAVVLTVSLMRLKEKNDRWVFFGGALLGGGFEYMCSVFTEIVFGKVFWDYSYMPLNINGRTNVLFMFFWGILGLVWVKIAYPPLDRGIEKLPPVTAKVITWVLVAFLALDAAITGFVILRYNERQSDPNPSNALEELIDTNFGDDFVANRWQNMIDT